MKIGVFLQIDLTAHLVNSNPQDMRSESSHRNYCKWTKTTKILNRSALLLYNACTLFGMIKNNNKLNSHPKGMATFKKQKKTKISKCLVGLLMSFPDKGHPSSFRARPFYWT